MDSQTIYLDYAATTPVDPEVLEAILPFLKQKFGNASAIYSLGAQARAGVENAREQVATLIGVQNPEEVVFTSGGTESDNWAVRGTAWANKDKGKHIISSTIEHHAIQESLVWLQKEGFETTFLEVDKFGFVDPNELRIKIRKDTILVSVMHANNEVGTIQPLKEFAEIAHENGALFHTDAVQSVGKIPVDVLDLDVDLLSLSAHKIYSMKGAGALYVKRGTRIYPLMAGGGQERARRGGTYNVPGIVGLGKACEIAEYQLPTEHPRQILLRDTLISQIMDKIPDVQLNGHRINRLPFNAHFSFQNVEGESLVLNMDMMGLCCSAGAACSSGEVEPSHVLTAMRLPEDWVRGAVRFSLGRFTTENEIMRAVEIVSSAVEQVRRLKT